MQEIEPLIVMPWWVPVVLAAAAISAGLRHVYWMWWGFRVRHVKLSPELEKALRGVKPPPYALYAGGWFAVAAVFLYLAAQLIR